MLRYVCPACAGVTEISFGPGGMSGNHMLRCNRCSAPTLLSVYDNRVQHLQSLFSANEKAFCAISENLHLCECGGMFEIIAPARRVVFREPVEPKAFRFQTGKTWRGNMLSRGIVSASWRQFCSFCGKEDDTVSVVDEFRNIFACAGCRANAA